MVLYLLYTLTYAVLSSTPSPVCTYPPPHSPEKSNNSILRFLGLFGWPSSSQFFIGCKYSPSSTNATCVTYVASDAYVLLLRDVFRFVSPATAASSSSSSHPRLGSLLYIWGLQKSCMDFGVQWMWRLHSCHLTQLEIPRLAEWWSLHLLLHRIKSDSSCLSH